MVRMMRNHTNNWKHIPLCGSAIQTTALLLYTVKTLHSNLLDTRTVSGVIYITLLRVDVLRLVPAQEEETDFTDHRHKPLSQLRRELNINTDRLREIHQVEASLTKNGRANERNQVQRPIGFNPREAFG